MIPGRRSPLNAGAARSRPPQPAEHRRGRRGAGCSRAAAAAHEAAVADGEPSL